MTPQKFDDQVGDCFNLMINGGITDKELIEKFGEEVFKIAQQHEKDYFDHLEDEEI